MFIKDQVYENVYLVFIDASGHSDVVRSNPRDISSQAFDLLYEKIAARLRKAAGRNKCGTAVVWSWLGDGGLIAIHDESEKTALGTAVTFAQTVLKMDLPALRLEFEGEDIEGEVHLRISIHKGTIKYMDEGQQGFIHSQDINWGAHLEKATPPDSISVSKDIYDIMTTAKKKEFVQAGQFEGREICIYAPGKAQALVRRDWMAAQGFGGVELVQGYLERLSQGDKAALIRTAEHTVIDFGTTLTTCANYLFSTERPVPYRDAVLDLLDRGGRFVCYMLSPDSQGSRQLAELRKENTDEKLKNTLVQFKEFKQKSSQAMESFQVYQYEYNSNMAAMFIDPESEDAVCLYSPYLSGMPEGDRMLDRADMPHYLVSRKKHGMYEYVWKYVSGYMSSAERVL